MRNLLRSEFLKLLTVRSTYVVLLLATVFIGIMAFYIEGFKGTSGSAAGQLTGLAFQEIVRNVTVSSGSLAAIVVILYVAHEYRFNTIMHTLTLANSRTKAFAAKLITAGTFSIFFALYCIGLALQMYLLGVALRGGTLAPQDFALALVGKSVFFVFGYAMVGLIITMLARNLAAAIALLLFGLGAIEAVLGLLLKENVKYLPMNSLQQVVSPVVIDGQPESAVRPAITFGVYLIVGWFVTWYLFLKRDAN